MKAAWFLSALLVVAVDAHADHQAHASAQSNGQSTAEASNLAAVPLGDVVGAAPNWTLPQLNLQAAKPGSAKSGEALFRTMNCAYCHGLKAKGVMGPDLTDGYWRYGGTPALIFKSIAEGRPQGMPAWGQMLPAAAIWDLVAYIESLGGAYPAGDEEAALEGDLAKGDTKPGAGLLPATMGSY